MITDFRYQGSRGSWREGPLHPPPPHTPTFLFVDPNLQKEMGPGGVNVLLPSRSEERGVLGVGSIPVVIFPSFQGIQIIALKLHQYKYSWVVKIRNTSEAVPRGSTQAPIHPVALWGLVGMIAKGSIVVLILPPLCFLY